MDWRRAVPIAATLCLLAPAAAGCASPDHPTGIVAAPAPSTIPAPPLTVPAGPTTVVPTELPVAAATRPAAGADSPATGFSASTSPVTADDLGASWRAGCPVGPDRLSRVEVTYWGFDDQPHPGSIVVDTSVAAAVGGVFRQLYEQRFPIRRVEPVDAFGADDNASMAADNTSGFNCRAAVADGPTHWSAHAYGQAIDVNPVENPYLTDGAVLPPAGADYADRSVVRAGMAVTGGALTSAFAAVGWQWGGTWSSPDYQHFSAMGG